jgi:glycosyltransferase involved in cell wall biosynthesis
MRPWLSIVIPARNDAAALARTLDHLDATGIARAAEVIVGASGDRDGTVDAVRDRAQIVWPEGSTRAALMNAGAAVATGDVLFFLHADSLPPADAVASIERALQDAPVVGGAFEHLFDEHEWSLRAISYLNRLRYRLTRNYYGDQGLFVRSEAFGRLGGFRDWALMEDLDLSQRLKRMGRCPCARR